MDRPFPNPHPLLRAAARGTLALLAAMAVGAAQATLLVEAHSVSIAQSGPQPDGSTAHARNGALVPGGNVAGPNGSSSAGATMTAAFADTTQISGAVLTTSYAAADLATGSLHVYAEAGAAGPSLGFGFARWIDTITFNNTTGGVLALEFFWETLGSVTDQNGPALGSQNITSSIVLGQNSQNFSSISLQHLNPGVLGGAQFNYGTFGGPGGSYFTFQPAGNNNAGAWHTQFTGLASGLLSATLLVPPGLASIDIDASLNVDCRTGAICDFGHTSSFRFGDLPDGLSWTSGSGVFLSAVDPGTVPEPGSLAWLALGLLFCLRAFHSRR